MTSGGTHIDPHSVRGLINAYEQGQLDFPNMVRLIVARYQEIGPHQNKPGPGEENWTDYMRGEQVPGQDDGFWINAAQGLGVFVPEQVSYLQSAIHKAFEGHEDSELFL
jgi:hypothetical protein